jgi:hypothetical protein
MRWFGEQCSQGLSATVAAQPAEGTMRRVAVLLITLLCLCGMYAFETAEAGAETCFTFPNLSGDAGSQMAMDLGFSNADSILAVEATVTYPPDKLSVVSVVKTSLSNSMSLAANTTTPGTIKVAMAGASGISGNGELFRINFTLKDSPGVAVVSLTEILVNDVSSTCITSGSITVAAKSQITVTSPNGGENRVVGNICPIEWTYTDDPGTQVKITLLKAGKAVKTIASAASIGTNGAGSFQWPIPATQTPGDDYQIKIVSTTKGSCTDASDNNFSIAPLPITLLAPNGGETWKVGSKYTVKWKYTVDIGPTVTIELLKGATVVKIIAASAVSGSLGTGSFPWTIPRNLSYGSNYRIRLRGSASASYTDTSDNVFAISGPTLDVTAPDGGESWPKGSQQNITWTYTGNPGGKVKIQLLKAGVSVRTITSGTSIGSDSKGSFPWTVPSDLAIASKYRVKITHTAISGCTATSNGNFSIARAVVASSAGPDQKVAEVAQVKLSGTNSIGIDKGTATYSWSQIDGPQAKLSNPAAAEPTFTVPEAGADGKSMMFQLTVTGEDGSQAQDSCIVNLTDRNSPPTADAGPSQTVVSGQHVVLDGSASYDLDDSVAGYSWKQIAGPQIILSEPASIQPTFTAPEGGQQGEALVFQLTVTDQGGLRARDTCIVNVSSANQPPQADAGPDQTLSPGALVRLNGSASADADDGIVSFRWTQRTGSPVTLSDPAAVEPTFFAPDTGKGKEELVFQLMVTDAGGLQHKALTTLIVTEDASASDLE